VAVAIALCADATGAEAAGRAGCSRFAWKRLLRSRSIDVITRSTGSAGEPERIVVYACVPPSGHVWLVGIAHGVFGDSVGVSASVEVHSGTWAVIALTDPEDPHDTSVLHKLCNARTGTSHTFWTEHENFVLRENGEQPEGEESLVTSRLNQFGQLLLEVERNGRTPTREVLAVQPKGTARTLDSAPAPAIQPQSLGLNGHEATWTDGIEHRRATI
jgi:hypothetical protein